jgi:hypothetical protein
LEIRSQPGAKVVTIGRSRSSAGAGGWQKRALVRKRPFPVRAGWVVISGPHGAEARVKGEIQLRHSGSSSRAALDPARHSIGKDRKPDGAVIQEVLDAIFPQVAKSVQRRPRDVGLDVDCAVESCDPPQLHR